MVDSRLTSSHAIDLVHDQQSTAECVILHFALTIHPLILSQVYIFKNMFKATEMK